MKQSKLIAKWLIHEGKRLQQLYNQVDSDIIDTTAIRNVKLLSNSIISEFVVNSREFRTINVADSSKIVQEMTLNIPDHLDKPLTGREYNMLIHVDEKTIFTLLYYERV
jgi:hypothetical protein